MASSKRRRERARDSRIVNRWEEASTGYCPIAADTVAGTRASDDATMQVSASLPAVISITEALPDARFPNFKGIMAAKKKPLEVKTLADYGIDAEDMTSSRGIMVSIAERPPRAAGVKITDEGDAAQKLAAFLAENRLV